MQALAPQHAALLAASAIAPAVADARGYRTITTKAELTRLGFTDRQARVPALLLPLWSVHGEPAGYQIRPDAPRVNGDGRPVKYEMPGGARMILDVPPGARPQLADPVLPLFVTEGVRKADSAVSAGLCCTALLGVDCWRGTNEFGGRTALPDWEAVALNGRRVYLCFDSDLLTKPAVHKALARLRAFLQSRGADVLVVNLPPGPGGAKCGLDDYLAGGHSVQELQALATPDLPAPPHEEGGDLPYRATDAGLVWVKDTRDGPIEQPLANFTAQIVGDVVIDDGTETTRQFEVEAQRGRRSARFLLPAAQFAAMGWPAEHLGAGAVVYAGFGTKDHARVAIQLLSGEVPERRVYAHTGWRQIGGEWAYLHAGGAIGAAGPMPGVEVRLERELARYALPDPPDEEGVRQAVRASLRFLQIAPPEQTWPLLAAVYSAPLGEMLRCDFALWVCGPTGARKSTGTALALCHYGAFTRTGLPANFTSTGNALEMLSFTTKDAILAVDDYSPAPDARTAAAQDAAAHRLLRAVGDTHGRNRATPDARLRGEKAPRCLPVVTAELPAPGSQSSAARTLEVEWPAGSVNLDVLTRAQEQDAACYPQALAAYVRWLAPQVDALRHSLPAGVRQRARLFENAGITHGRIAETAAKLLLGAGSLALFAQECGAVAGEEAERMLAEAQAALLACARRTSHAQAGRKPTALFFEMLAAMLTQGAVYLKERATSDVPADAGRWGYTETRYVSQPGADPLALPAAKPGAEFVGWVDSAAGLLYLQPLAAHRAVFRYAQASGGQFPATKEALGKALKREGLLLLPDPDKKGDGAERTARKVRLPAEERTVWAWCVRADNLEPPIPPETGNSGNSGNSLPETQAPCGFPAPDPVPTSSASACELGTEVGTAAGGTGPVPTPVPTPAPAPAELGTPARPTDPRKPQEPCGPSLFPEEPVPTVPTVPTSAEHRAADPASAPRVSQSVCVRAPLLVADAAGVAALARDLAGAKRIALDTETTGLNPRKDRLRLLSLATDAGCWVVDVFRADPRPLFPVLAGKPLVAHNALFDLSFLAGLGFPLRPADDTMLLSHLLRAGRRERHGLRYVVARELHQELPKELQRSDWSGALSPAQIEYAGRDAAILLPLYRALAEGIATAGLQDAAEVERRCLPAMAWLSLSGVPFDTPAWEALALAAEEDTRKAEQALNAVAPAPPGLPELGAAWNWNSPAIVARVFREAGCELARADDEALAACDHPLAGLLRTYREAAKRSGAYGRKWLELAEDGRLYPSWRQIGAESGRMACADPNVQQTPRGKAYRACIAAPAGRALVKGDYSQIELRIAARVANEPRMLAAYRAGADLHIETARQILGRQDVAKEDRQLAKAVNFGLLYGMGAEGFRAYAEAQYGVKLTPEEAEHYRGAFFRAYGGLVAWHRKTRREKASEARTLAGRRRLFDANTPDTQRLNTPVQGTGADGLKRALALLWERREQQPSAFPVLVCHDEIVVECPAEEADSAAEWLRQAMLDGMEPLTCPVPVEVETQIGRTWAG